MKNQYEVRGDTTIIALVRRDGLSLAVLIDTTDLPRLLEHGGTWVPFLQPNGRIYAKRNRLKGEKAQSSLLHRLLLDAPIGLDVDHIDHNGLDNRRSNLRLATRAQNLANTRVVTRNTSGFKGVSWNKKLQRWQSHIRINGRSTYLGLFDSPDVAARAYDQAAINHHGAFACLNFPSPPVKSNENDEAA